MDDITCTEAFVYGALGFLSTGTLYISILAIRAYATRNDKTEDPPIEKAIEYEYDKILREHDISQTEFKLPGAPNLTEFLRNAYDGNLTVLPLNSMWNMQIDGVFHEEKHIGTYIISKVEGEPDDFLRSFQGNIPGFEETVQLQWGNKSYERVQGKTVMVRNDGKWQRNDHYEGIPFP